MVVGGSEPGPATLIRFYAWHIFGLTLLLVIVGVWHLFRVRRDGGIAAPPPAYRTDPSRITRAQLVRREVLAAFFASIVLIGLAILFPAPIGPALGRDVPPERLYADARAPWFFLWVQRLLRWGDPFWMGVFVPLIILIVLALLPYLFARLPPMELGRWLPPGGRRAQIMTAVIFLGLVVLTLLEWFPATKP
jgi:quinol-cytochrome oxidoreductase complex cytochrome b subunit